MIDLYFWTTDNGYKARHMMEESGLEYTIKPINLQAGEQNQPEYLKINPAHKIPAIIDHDGPGGETLTLTESGAILKYVGAKAGNGLYPSDPMKQIKIDQWLFYGSAQYTTLCQQFGYFWRRAPEPIEEAKKHYKNVLTEMFGLLDSQLSDREFIAGDFSVADISMYSDTHIYSAAEFIGFDGFPNFKRWHDTIEARPAAKRAWGPYE